MYHLKKDQANQKNCFMTTAEYSAVVTNRPVESSVFLSFLLRVHEYNVIVSLEPLFLSQLGTHDDDRAE